MIAHGLVFFFFFFYLFLITILITIIVVQLDDLGEGYNVELKRKNMITNTYDHNTMYDVALLKGDIR